LPGIALESCQGRYEFGHLRSITIVASLPDLQSTPVVLDAVLAWFAMQYSFSLTTFSPSGKLMQIEYALNAVSAGAISLGIKATNGVVLATEKKLPSTLIDESTVRKINDLSGNIGVVYSGMGPDNRVLVKRARRVAQAYYMQYNEEIPVAQLVRDLAAVMQEYTRAPLPMLVCHSICQR
jgi:20S proteasome alpha/beta subunit